MDIAAVISSSINHSVLEVFSTMLTVNLAPGEVLPGPGSEESSEGVVSFIGLAGAWAGTGTVMCSAPMACRICSQMLMTDAQSVDEEVLDAVAELTNIVIGSVKNELEPHLGPLGLSIPTVIFGRNFKTKSSAHAQWVVVRFGWDGEDFVVKLCMAPSEKPHLPHTIGQTEAVDVKL